MKLVVGLGNPGRRYEGTRHNVGFIVVGELAKKYSAGGLKNRFQGETAEIVVDGEKILLLTPTTYMNLSGASVLAARDFYKIPQENLLVVCDDLNLPLAKLRMRATGSAGGQKGLEDIIRRLGTDVFARLRIGIGAPPDGRSWPDFVLSKFTKEEIPAMEQAVARTIEAIEGWAREGVQSCMNRYNG
ncbi:MAG: aminoacyl-tRNA hydrolase [Planctomycetota bacterium]